MNNGKQLQPIDRLFSLIVPFSQTLSGAILYVRLYELRVNTWEWIKDDSTAVHVLSACVCLAQVAG